MLLLQLGSGDVVAAIYRCIAIMSACTSSSVMQEKRCSLYWCNVVLRTASPFQS